MTTEQVAAGTALGDLRRFHPARLATILGRALYDGDIEAAEAVRAAG